MKRLFLFPVFFSFFLVSAQSLAGIPEEHMITYGHSATQDVDAPSIHRIALSTGVSLEYAEQGDKNGIPLILLHGLSDSWKSFETTLPHLPQVFHTFAISQRGHGNSDRPTADYTPGHFAADIAAFVEQRQLGPVVVAGHSMGGIVAQQFALSYPRLTRSLVIISSDAAIGKNPGMPEFAKEVSKMEGPPNRDFTIQFQSSTIARPIDSSYFNMLVEESMRVPTSVFKAVVSQFLDADFTGQLKNIRQPTLIFWGDKDLLFPLEGQKRLTKSLPKAKWIVYNGAGHSLHWEEPQRFANDLTEFLQTRVLRK